MKKKFKCAKCNKNKVYERGIVYTPCFDSYWKPVRSIAEEQELDDDDPEEEDES